MKAIILAAGRGSRMGKLTDGAHKCQTHLHGKSLLDWQLTSLRKSGICDIAIVKGYLADTIKAEQTHTFFNPGWRTSNMVRSLMYADEWLKHFDCIISYADIVYTSNVVKCLAASNKPITISYDPCWLDLWKIRFDDPLEDAETFKINKGRVTEIGLKPKTIDEIEGQYMGLLKMTPIAWDLIMRLLQRLTSSEIDKLDMTKLLQSVIQQQAHACSVGVNKDQFLAKK